MIAPKYKIAVMALVIAGVCSASYYFSEFLGSCMFAAHVFYFPIALASFWWGRKGLVVAVFSAAFLLLGPHSQSLSYVYFRAVILLAIGFVIAELREQVIKKQGVLGADNQQLLASAQQLKAANEQLRASEEQFRAMVGAAFDGIYIGESTSDLSKWRIVFCNDKYVEMSGRTREQLMKAENIGEFITSYNTPEQQARGRECIVNGTPFTGLGSWKRPDGKENFYEWSAASVKKGNHVHIIGINRDITARKKVDEELQANRQHLRELASELVLAEEHLRRRIAQNLHDDVGQDLLLVKMRLSELCKEMASKKKTATIMGILTLVEKAIQNTRSLLIDLSPPVLYKLGLEAALEWLMEKAESDHGITGVFEDDGQAKPLTDDLRVGLFRAVRELLLNVVKHAQAKTIKVSVRKDAANILVHVADDGVGFDVEKVQARGDLGKGFGLFDIRERLGHFGGSFELQSKLGQGTQVTLLAPLA